jgi:hypothetical protein
LEKVRVLKLPSEEEAMVLGGNFLRLIRRARTSPAGRARIRARAAPADGEFRDPWTTPMVQIV